MKKRGLSWQDVTGACLNICREIHQDAWRPDYIIGITRGGVIPAMLISQYLDIPMRALTVSLRDHIDTVSDLESAENAIGYVPLHDKTLHGGHARVECLVKNILIVDDINDTGATINWIKQDWQQNCLPTNERWKTVWHENVRFATLVHNLGSESDVDYYFWDVDKRQDDTWIEFPWENYWCK